MSLKSYSIADQCYDNFVFDSLTNKNALVECPGIIILFFIIIIIYDFIFQLMNRCTTTMYSILVRLRKGGIRMCIACKCKIFALG